MESATILVVAVVLAVATYLDRKDKFREMVLSFTAGLMDEAIAYSEVRNLYLKREAVFNATKAWQKQKPEVMKDQIQADRFLQDAMAPARSIAHTDAKNYITETVQGLPGGRVKTAVTRMLFSDAGVLDRGIKMRITAARINIQDPVKPFLYRYL